VGSPSVRLNSLDLNLVVSLRELLRERNVTRAALRIGVSQPAASAALARLRKHFDDELLTRHSGGYVLTPLAAQLADQVDGVCAALERLFGTGQSFDPGASHRSFTLLLADYSAGVVGPALSAALTEQAPGAELRFRLVRESFSTAIGETIRLIDGMIAPYTPRFDIPELHSVPLFEDRWVCLVDRHHPLAGEPEPTAGQLATFPWVVPFVSDPGPSPAAPISRELLRLGIRPTVQVRLESYLLVPSMVAGTDRVALLQERLARDAADRLGLVVLACPGDPEPIHERLWWHADFDDDPAHRWLRTLVVERTAIALTSAYQSG
jgi:DNA-binding transcriptional LysR family regulator